jgi:tyrosinase
MSSSRREVLLHGAVFAAGVIASASPGLSALAQGAPPQRRTLTGLTWNDPIVATYRDAVGIMKQMKDSEKLSWMNLASIHGSNPSQYHFCPHGDWYFLPWHRAYLVMYERVIRQLTHNDSFAFPYWDWTADPVMPQLFTQPKTPDGKPNPLFVNDKGWARTWPANKPMPAENVGPAVLDQILAATEYEEFGTSRNLTQSNLDPAWVVRGGGAQGVLEGNAHNTVHNNIGGWMPTASSPRDPIFFMHHCNIDRIWAVWNLRNSNSGDTLWTDMVFPNNFLKVDGSFWSPKVSDLYDPATLGYSYGIESMAVAASTANAPKLLALRGKLTSMFAAAVPNGMSVGGGGPSGIVTVTAANPGTATPAHPLEVTITAPSGVLQSLRQTAPLGSGTALLNFSATQERAASSARVIAFLRDVMVTSPKTTVYRVFIDRGEVSGTTPITDPGYVGSFSVFNHGHHTEHELPSFALDLTAALRRVGGSAGNAPGQIRLQVVPVGESGVPGTATLSRVEVSFIMA